MTEKALTIAQFCGAYKVGRTVVFEQIKNEKIATYKLGRRRYISAQAAVNWQADLEAKANKNAGGSQ